jgi:hypothetical protein
MVLFLPQDLEGVRLRKELIFKNYLSTKPYLVTSHE